MNNHTATSMMVMEGPTIRPKKKKRLTPFKPCYFERFMQHSELPRPFAQPIKEGDPVIDQKGATLPSQRSEQQEATCPKCHRPMNLGNSPNKDECTETDDEEGLCEAYAALAAERKKTVRWQVREMSAQQQLLSAQAAIQEHNENCSDVHCGPIQVKDIQPVAEKRS